MSLSYSYACHIWDSTESAVRDTVNDGALCCLADVMRHQMNGMQCYSYKESLAYQCFE